MSDKDKGPVWASKNQTIQDAMERVDGCRNGFLETTPSEEFMLQFRTELLDLLQVVEMVFRRVYGTKTTK